MLEKTFKYELERGSNKYKCPNCHRKTFVRFVNNDTGEYITGTFGRCDREQKCGYFNIPSMGNNNYIAMPIKLIPPEPSFISLHHVNSTFEPDREKDNNFIKFLNTLFSPKEVNTVVQNYLISTCSYWGSSGATIFWQIDEQERVRTGQIILYDSISGKRKKKPFSHIFWYHSLLKKNKEIVNFNLSQCLFGLHLVNQHPDKALIAIVESPKTACIMSIIFPKYLWLATCGLSNLKPALFHSLRKKILVLYPDLGASDIWKKKAQNLISLGYKLQISDFMEKRKAFVPEGSDIADYFIMKHEIDNVKKAR